MAPINQQRGKKMSKGIRCAYFAAVGLVGVVVILVVVFSVLPQFDAMTSQTRENAPTRVVIVGGGLAGLSAAVEASRHGAWVTIIEKEKNIGGNSAKATSGINAVGTSAQKAKGIDDSINVYIQDTLKSGDGLSNEELVNILATNSAAAIDFLESFGLKLSDVVQLGGHSVARTHRFPPTAEGKPVPVGWTLISTLKKYIQSSLKDTVNVLTLSNFKQLVITDGHITGLEYTDSNGSVQTVEGAVVLTSGGFANDHTASSLLDKYVPSLASLPTTNGAWATGDIIKATSGANLSLIHMNRVQVHPTGFIEPSQPLAHTKFLAPEAIRGCGAILLDAEGKRFVNELGRRDHVTGKMMAHCKPYKGVEHNPLVATMLLTQKVIDRFGAPAVGFYRFKGLIEDVGSLAKVAETLGVSLDVLRETLHAYKDAAGHDSDNFGKTVFPLTFEDDDHFFVAYVTPSLHYCMGGLKINANAQVLQVNAASAKAQSLPGLFAAGEVTGGVHGNNRLGGNSLLECVVFGRIAGQHAAHYV